MPSTIGVADAATRSLATFTTTSPLEVRCIVLLGIGARNDRPRYLWFAYTGRRYSGGMAMHEPTFYILTALAERPQHGYGIMQTVSRLSGERVTLRAGTLYAALDRLTTEGLLAVDREEAL